MAHTFASDAPAPIYLDSGVSHVTAVEPERRDEEVDPAFEAVTVIEEHDARKRRVVVEGRNAGPPSEQVGRGPSRGGTSLEVDVLAHEPILRGPGYNQPEEARPEEDGLSADKDDRWISGHRRQLPKDPKHLVGTEGRRCRHDSAQRLGGFEVRARDRCQLGEDPVLLVQLRDRLLAGLKRAPILIAGALLLRPQLGGIEPILKIERHRHIVSASEPGSVTTPASR